ncbi:hypothetical protein PUV44_20485 [Xanthomonas arboricola pv. corylina]|nr:hypothetical protein PUV44_20485 [Xanthomonas arboricola pv. corylina]
MRLIRGSANGDPVAAYAVSRVAEMRGDARAGITREVMIAKPLTTEQKMLGESEALRLNQAINQIYISKHGVAPILDKRPIGGNSFLLFLSRSELKWGLEKGLVLLFCP